MSDRPAAVRPPPTPTAPAAERGDVDARAPVVVAGGRPALLAATLAYLALGLVVWWGAWAHHPATTTTCGCGDSALFLWFFAWPAHALAHGLDPFFSTAMSWPGGVNLLANTSVPGLAIPLVPVTWAFGPVASMNVALTLAPVLSALAVYLLVRRWVAWAPAAFAAGLVYGFSPVVVVSLGDAHLMVGWAVVPPLLVLAVDELVRGRRGAVSVGLALGFLVVVQFFVGTEMLLVVGIVAVPSAAFALGWAAVTGRLAGPGGRRRVRRVAVGLATAGVVAVVVLAWPTWYALAGPAHTSGKVWPTLDLATEGSSLHALLWPAPERAGFSLFTQRVGGPQGPIPSDEYLGWGMVAVIVGGLVAFRRDRRLWWCTASALVAVVLSLGVHDGRWLPWSVAAHLPVLENIIPSRFLLVAWLGLGAALGLVADHVRTRLRSASAPGVRELAPWAAVAVAAVGIVPVAVELAPAVPAATQPVRLPTWFTTVAPHLPDHTVLLVFPVPYQTVESSMAWQGVAGFPYAMVGGGGPGGAVQRAGSRRSALEAIGRASFSFTSQLLRAGDVVATRRAFVAWGLDEVVLPDEPTLAPYDRVASVPDTVAFVTAVTGRAPVRQAGAWVWPRADRDLPAGPGPPAARVAACQAPGPAGTTPSVEQVAHCVLVRG